MASSNSSLAIEETALANNFNTFPEDILMLRDVKVTLMDATIKYKKEVTTIIQNRLEP